MCTTVWDFWFILFQLLSKKFTLSSVCVPPSPSPPFPSLTPSVSPSLPPSHLPSLSSSLHPFPPPSLPPSIPLSLPPFLQPVFLAALANELGNTAKSDVARMAAGLQLKNHLTAKTVEAKIRTQQTWLRIDPTVRLDIKRMVRVFVLTLCSIYYC